MIKPCRRVIKLLANLYLSFLPKIPVKVFTRQLCDYLQRHNFFEDFQSGFRVHYSTETVPVKVSSDLLTASAQGLMSVLVLLDLRAAFDTVDHHMLLLRMEKLSGLKGSALNCFRSYP